MIGTVNAQTPHRTEPLMKSLSIIAALALGLAAQGSAAQPTPLLSPGTPPDLAHEHMPKYDIVTAQVVESVKFANPQPTRSLNPRASPADWAVFNPLPARD
jgi:hypothetical protein